ncbi:7677_t:CDS:2 [Dentiscutata erythropus]|uniref:7677_t:CDS:1 n=1 Tax=Dentiscutata erythropus TaxID=1348616 RepID=A0A9N9IDC5_9GLOM|nr:7677_t:CDS:2 [Dentiscutata erythropus]
MTQYPQTQDANIPSSTLPVIQTILQPPNIQEIPQNIQVNNEVVQPNFSHNIPSSRPYSCQYFSQPYQPPIIVDTNNAVYDGRNQSGNMTMNGNNNMVGYGNNNIGGYGNNNMGGTAPGYQVNSAYQTNVANVHQNDPAAANSYVISSVNSYGQNEYYVIR